MHRSRPNASTSSLSQSPSPSPSPSPNAEITTGFLTTNHTDEPPTQQEYPSRWSLRLKARILRFLARIGFYLHTFPKPSPPAPSFYRDFQTRALEGDNGKGTNSASLELAFYVPPDYSKQVQHGYRYPVVVNYHGGGFTMGTTTDDARWAAMVIRETSAVVVSVAYRLAPEHPFPIAVEDSVCALLHLATNAEILGLDASKITLSGFSAGGNLAFTVPLRLQTYLRTLGEEREGRNQAPHPRIVSIIAWYPNVDNRISRTQRRASSLNPLKTLPPILTNLFDASYFPNAEDVLSPYASPAVATDEDLKQALPDDIAMYLCEWDMLLQEEKAFEARLRSLGKRVRCEIIKERMHGFDKSPLPFKLDWKVQVYYEQACEWLREIYKEV